MRRLPVGAEFTPGKGTHFRVWAPIRKTVEVVVGGSSVPLSPEPDGYFSGVVADAGPGTRYRYRLDGSGEFPDPASRYQPEGPHGWSEVVDPDAFVWRDSQWTGARLEGQVVYEMHIGTFTQEGTFEAARQQIPELASAGITLLEVMPIADFPGRFGWGYDGVGLFAPVWLYGTPDDFRRFVDDAHTNGVGVILDVVYNHFGPDGNYLKEYSPDYFSDRYKNEWGEAINFDGPNSGPVREFFIANAGYWISEFHLDGLRLDATQQIFDASPENIMTAVGRRVREAANGRATVIVAENEEQHTKLVRPAGRGGYGLDALWNDDYHHSAMVAMTGFNEAYYTDYLGSPQEFISAIKYGYLYQGQRYKWQKQRRGTPGLDVRPAQFVAYMQNHDQVANSGRGERCNLLTAPGRFRAMTALLLLGPNTPMLFQGQEFAASTPFHYFADHKPDLANLVRSGRAEFLSQFPSIAQPEMRAWLRDPADPATFLGSKLDFHQRATHAPFYQMTKDLLRLRREDPVFSAQRHGGVDGAVLSGEAFVLRFFGGPDGDRLVLVNLGRDLHLDPAPEPLLAPPAGMRWEILFSTENPLYGGCGTPPADSESNWFVHAHSALALRPIPQAEEIDG